MPKLKKAEPLRLKPLTGSFDSRSLPELVGVDQWRLLQNTRVTAQGRLCRLPGWQKFLSGHATNRDYNNEDLHDQLLSLQNYYASLADVDSSGVISYPPDNADFGDFCGTTLLTRPQGRQPITFEAQVTSSRDTRRFITGTQSRLYMLNPDAGNYKILADGLGGTQDNPEIRFRHAALGDYVFFTNNFDEPFYWQIGQPTSGCSMQSVQNIPEMQEIGITKAALVAEFKGVLFWADVEQDGERRRNRIIWSGYQKPLSYVEDPFQAQPGTQDLSYGEIILGMKELGDFLFIYTDRAIWFVAVTSAGSFAIVRRYVAAEKNDGTLFYPHTLVGSKSAHYYAAVDGIYEWNPYITVPQRVQWIHQSSNILYDDINKSACAIHTGFYSSKTREIWFSFAQGTDKLPSVTLTCNTEYNKCSKVDHGFTAGCEFIPDDRQSVRDWLIDNCIVSEACLDSAGVREMGFVEPKEGAGVPRTVEPCTSYPDHVYTNVLLDLGDGVVVEDYNQPAPTEDSLCSRLGDQSIAEGCEDCEADIRFVVASAADYCLKEVGPVYYRERWVEGTTYANDGYTTRFLKGPLSFGTDTNKLLSGVLMEFEAEPQAIPTSMNLRIGAAHRAIDPLSDCNAISWYDAGDLPIVCKDDDRNMEWAVYALDSNLYFDFTISGTGGASCYSSLQTTLGPGGC